MKTYLQNGGAYEVVEHPTTCYALIRINISGVVELNANDCRHGYEGKDEAGADSSTRSDISKRTPNNITQTSHLVRPNPRRYPGCNGQDNDRDCAEEVGAFSSRLEWISLK